MLAFRTILKVLKFNLFILLLIHLSSAAVIEGKVYSWENFEPLSNVIVEINTTPEQKILSKDGSYSFNVSPGNYRIVAKYYEDGILVMEASENITVVEEGVYRIDLLLTPVIEMEEVNLENITFEEVNGDEEANYLPYIFVAVLLLIPPSIYFVKRSQKKEDKLPEDLREVVEVIKSFGGRITQKELRERLGVSEAKLSLMLSDLERRGIIEKYKKGRGNVIFLKE